MLRLDQSDVGSMTMGIFPQWTNLHLAEPDPVASKMRVAPSSSPSRITNRDGSSNGHDDRGTAGCALSTVGSREG
eukprot:7541024-Pyramimonas_sp.AAC.1